MKLLLFSLLSLVLLQCGNTSDHSLSNYIEQSNYLNYHLALQDVIGNLETKELNIYINKGNYSLAVLYKDSALKEYPVVFGGNPHDDKRMEGDKCTPEGKFSVRDHYPHKKWSKFIWVDYPTEESWKKHETAKSVGEIPNEASIGGEIGIHGVPEGKEGLILARTNWTLGCISLTNKDVDEIYPFVFKGMEIEITK